MDNRLRQLLAGYVDGELSPDELARFEKELAVNPELLAELKEFKKLKEVTGTMKYADLPDEVWESYWASIYRKTERGIGWILMSLGAIVLLCFGVYEGFSELYLNPDCPLWLKVGLTAVAGGAVFLLVSYGRERIFAYNRERYREVIK
ncbi:MAG: hypothetical protein DRP45_08785 [Candidatus Zixiibacteriota bacterium]|nr:MAG: hypothetical protein DRP45_08785 [candidate division Zixibacteria bacterium]